MADRRVILPASNPGNALSHGIAPARQRAWGRVTLPHWPHGDAVVRLTLLGLVVALQNLLEMPRDPVYALLGKAVTGVLVFVVLGASLGLLLAAVRTSPPSWRWLRSRRTQVAVLVLTLLAVPIGVLQVGRVAAAGFSAPVYENDGTTLDHYAAQQLLWGHNPYVTSDIVSAVRYLGQQPQRTTPLRQGVFADRAPIDYPDAETLRRVFATEPVGRPDQVREFETRVSYPALAFLPLVPFVWAGLPSVVPFFALCWLALAVLLVVSVPAGVRVWMGLLVLADAPLLNATLTGDLDVFYVLLLFIAYRWLDRRWVSVLALGGALAAKQLAWFFAPFYLLLVWQRYGWRSAVRRGLGAGAVFVAINLPFAATAPEAWLRGVLAPVADPMFPLGNGLIRLSLVGILPLMPSYVYTGFELLAIVGCLWWYWHCGRRTLAQGFALPVLPLWFAWRSLTTYFYFITLPGVALALAGRPENAAPVHAAHPEHRATDLSAARSRRENRMPRRRRRR